MNLAKDIYTAKEAGALIGISPAAIRAAIQAGKLKADKFNNSYVIRRDDFADYLDYRKGRDNGKQFN